MKNSRRHLSLKLIKYYLVLVIGLTIGCAEEKSDGRIVARVGSSSLTEEELNAALGSEQNSNKYREEFIRRWVETELLYKEAVNENITSEKQYEFYLEDVEKTLAGAILLDKITEGDIIEIDREEAEEYFENHKPEFRLPAEALILNQAEFTLKETADNFRYSVLEKGWDFAASNFGNSAEADIHKNRFTDSRSISDESVKRYLENLSPGDVSLVLKKQNDKYVVYEIVKRIEKGEIPDFQFIENRVTERVRMIKKKIVYKSIIDELYSKYEVKIY